MQGDYTLCIHNGNVMLQKFTHVIAQSDNLFVFMDGYLLL